MNRKVIEVDIDKNKDYHDAINEIYKSVGVYDLGLRTPDYQDRITKEISFHLDVFMDDMREFPIFKDEPRPLEVHMVLRGFGEFRTRDRQLAKDLVYCLTLLTDKDGNRYDGIDFTFSVKLE